MICRDRGELGGGGVVGGVTVECFPRFSFSASGLVGVYLRLWLQVIKCRKRDLIVISL